jgi:restriction system protein
MPDLPKYTDLLHPTLVAIAKLGGSARLNEINDEVIGQLALKPEQIDAAYEKSGVPIIPDRLSWARSWARLAGLLESGGRGIWVLTEKGRDTVALGEAAVREEVRLAANTYSENYKANKPSKAAEAATIDHADEVDGGAGPDWPDALLQRLLAVSPAGFERLCQRLLRESGFVKVEVTGKSGDGGIDGTGVLRMNLISFQVLFQCKRWQGSVSAGTVRDFRGAMQGRADKGLIITTGNFTPDARREATRDGAPAIDLIDGPTLCDLLKDRGLGVTVQQRIVEDVTLDEHFFQELD